MDSCITFYFYVSRYYIVITTQYFTLFIISAFLIVLCEIILFIPTFIFSQASYKCNFFKLYTLFLFFSDFFIKVFHSVQN